MRNSSLNGGLTDMLSAGLISQNDYNNGYGFIYCDLSGKTGLADDEVGKSVRLMFTNGASYTCDYHIILNYRKQFSINVSEGDVVV
jgi:hypothetical protein